MKSRAVLLFCHGLVIATFSLASTLRAAEGVIISEFLAANATGLPLRVPAW